MLVVQILVKLLVGTVNCVKPICRDSKVHGSESEDRPKQRSRRHVRVLQPVSTPVSKVPYVRFLVAD
jgi:hypothetical protein